MGKKFVSIIKDFCPIHVAERKRDPTPGLLSKFISLFCHEKRLFPLGFCPLLVRLMYHDPLLSRISSRKRSCATWILSHIKSFLDASSHLYKRVCPSVCPYVRPSVRPSVRMSVR